MDEYIIIETSTESASEIKQKEVHAARVLLAQSNGYTIVTALGVPGVPDGTKGIVGKTFEGLDDPNSITWRWDVPQQTPDGTFEIQDPADVAPVYTGTPEFDYVVRERPVEWIDSMEDKEFNAQFNTPEFE